MQDAKLKVNLMSSANKNKSLSATLPGNGARKILDNPQEPQEQEGKAIYSLQLECHNSSCLCTKQNKVTKGV